MQCFKNKGRALKCVIFPGCFSCGFQLSMTLTCFSFFLIERNIDFLRAATRAAILCSAKLEKDGVTSGATTWNRDPAQGNPTEWERGNKPQLHSSAFWSQTVPPTDQTQEDAVIHEDETPRNLSKADSWKTVSESWTERVQQPFYAALTGASEMLSASLKDASSSSGCSTFDPAL